jgi:hypothetical protein
VSNRESGPQTVHFRGVPAAVDSLVGISHALIGPTPRISINAQPPGFLLRGLSAFDEGGKASRLLLSLAGNTPPGTYTGSIDMAGKSFPAEILVEPFTHLTISPRQLLLSVHPGDRIELDLTIANTGNVPCDIGKTHAFGLYDVHGAEHGVRAAFRRDEGSSERSVDRLLDKLAAGHGGTVRVQIEKGHGLLDPGEVRSLRWNVHFPATVKPNHTYSGTLALENLRYYARVRVAEEK